MSDFHTIFNIQNSGAQGLGLGEGGSKNFGKGNIQSVSRQGNLLQRLELLSIPALYVLEVIILGVKESFLKLWVRAVSCLPLLQGTYRRGMPQKLYSTFVIAHCAWYAGNPNLSKKNYLLANFIFKKSKKQYRHFPKHPSSDTTRSQF